jgi:hypothetical protein
MNKPNDKDLREALRRRETHRQHPQPSADFCNNVMHRIGQQNKQHKHRRMWLFTTIGVAACIILLLTLHHNPIEQKEEPVVAQKTVRQLPTIQPAEQPVPLITKEETKRVVTKKTTAKPRIKTRKEEIPDTLGNGIWQNKENVMRAMQMLNECEVTIERGEQRIRNDIVRTTYQATPQSAHLQLVVCDNGDCMVVDDRQPVIIEL